MERHQFTSIEEVRQAHLLLKTGVLVAKRKKGFYKVELYQLASCYLEVYRHSHFNVIIKVNRFTDPAYLDPFLKDLDISYLLPNS